MSDKGVCCFDTPGSIYFIHVVSVDSYFWRMKNGLQNVVVSFTNLCLVENMEICSFDDKQITYYLLIQLQYPLGYYNYFKFIGCRLKFN